MPKLLFRADLPAIIFSMRWSELDISSNANPIKIKKTETIFRTSLKLEIDKLVLIKHTQHITNDHQYHEIGSICQAIFYEITFTKPLPKQHEDNQQHRTPYFIYFQSHVERSACPVKYATQIMKRFLYGGRSEKDPKQSYNAKINQGEERIPEEGVAL